jgi:hypothetical protein
VTRPAIYSWQNTSCYCRKEPRKACWRWMDGGINWIFRFRHVTRVHLGARTACWLYVSVFKRRMWIHHNAILLTDSLPHITLLYLNAAHAQLLGNDYWALTKQLLTEGPIEAFTRPKFMREAGGVLTKDGKSGMVWTTNVLSTYVLVSHAKLSVENMLTSLGKGIGQSTPKVSFDASIRSAYHPYFITYCGFLCVKR